MQQNTFFRKHCSSTSNFNGMDVHENKDKDQLFCNPFPNDNFLKFSKLKEFADNNFKFDENGRKFSEYIENTV